MPLCQGSNTSEHPAQILAWMPVFFAEDALVTAPYCAEPHSTNFLRGRACTKERLKRLPSRTPSPSGCSLCLSEASTTAESWLTQEGYVTGTSILDLNEYVENLDESDDIPVKNTFVHFSRADTEDSQPSARKLLRSSSAPSMLLSSTFQILEIPTMLELHNLGKCSPCGYFYAKSDSCRQGSDCNFCHFCPEDAVKNRKKMKVKASKAARKAALNTESADRSASVLRQ